MMEPCDSQGVHFAHCYQGENEGGCKYGDDDCPVALSPQREDTGEYVMVPREPTEAMRAAGSVAMDARNAAEWSVWSAMLAAAPPAPTEGVAAADRIAALESALRDCADDLEAEVASRYPSEVLAYPTMKRSFQRDMDAVTRARAALSDGGDHAR